MRVADFYFDLPDELIARYPKTERTASRLLQLNGENGDIFHRTFADVLELIHQNYWLCLKADNALKKLRIY